MFAHLMAVALLAVPAKAEVLANSGLTYTYTYDPSVTVTGIGANTEITGRSVLNDGFFTTQADITENGVSSGWEVNGGQLNGVIIGTGTGNNRSIVFDLGSVQSLGSVDMYYVAYGPAAVDAPWQVDVIIDGGAPISFNPFDISATISPWGDARMATIDLTGQSGQTVELDFYSDGRTDLAGGGAQSGSGGEWTSMNEIVFRAPIIQFQIIEGNFTWQEAKADAEAKGGRLAVLDTEAKNNTALEALTAQPSGRSYFIGLSRENPDNRWEWISGETLEYENWGEGEPSGGEEKFGTITTGGWGLLKLGDWNDGGEGSASYLLEIIPQNPAPPLVQLGALFESPSGEAIAIDATPTAGFPTGYTYQWCFNGFKIPANLGGTASSINIDNLQANEGTWSVTVTNETGSVEQSFEYRIYADTDSDGLSDAYEELISETDINNSDTDNDGLTDGDEVNTYSTNPNSSDSDSDGFTDLYELETAYDPNSAESTPDAQVNIMTAIEVDFNAALGATYEIQFSTDTIEWTVIEAGIVGEGNAVERLYSRKDFPTGFFRVERTDQ